MQQEVRIWWMERWMRSSRLVSHQDRISASLTQARRNLKHRESDLSDKKVHKLQEDVRLNFHLLHNSKQLWRRLKLRSRGCSHRCLGGGLLLPSALLRLAAVMASPASSSTAATLASEVTAGDSGSGNSSVVRKIRAVRGSWSPSSTNWMKQYRHT